VSLLYINVEVAKVVGIELFEELLHTGKVDRKEDEGDKVKLTSSRLGDKIT